MKMQNGQNVCSVIHKCGGCQYQGMAYEEQLKKKQKYIEGVLGKHSKPDFIIGMENP